MPNDNMPLLNAEAPGLMPPQESIAFAGFFGGNALSRWSATYIDTRQVVQDIQTLAAWCRANQNATSAILATFPSSIEGLLPGALYWDGMVFSKAPEDPSTYPTSSEGLHAGDVYFSSGAYHIA